MVNGLGKGIFFRGSIGDIMLVASAKRGVLGVFKEMPDSLDDALISIAGSVLSLLELAAILEVARC